MPRRIPQSGDARRDGPPYPDGPENISEKFRIILLHRQLTKTTPFDLSLKLFLTITICRAKFGFSDEIEGATEGANVRIVYLILMSFGLASCYAATESDLATRSPRQDGPQLATMGPGVPRLSTPTVSTARTVIAYHGDLQRCRNEAALVLGADRATDDVAALRRELSQVTPGKTLDLQYRTGDLALDRDKRVKTCLARLGYSIKD